MSIGLGLGLVAAGFLIGVLSGYFGVGGGMLMVPLMVLLLSETQHVAEGTSLLVIVPTAVVGVLSHRRRGYVSFRAAALIAVGGVPGGYLGGWLAHRISGEALQVAFAVVLAVAGARLVLEGARVLRAGLRGADSSPPLRGPEP